MKNNWRTIGEIIGLVAIVGSLGLVAWEVKQANALGRAGMSSERFNNYNQLNIIAFSNPEVASFHVQMAEMDLQEFNKIDRMRVKFYAHWLRGTWIVSEKMYDNGQLDDRSFNGMLQDIIITIGDYPALKPALRSNTENYRDESRPYQVDEAILKATSPD